MARRCDHTFELFQTTEKKVTYGNKREMDPDTVKWKGRQGKQTLGVMQNLVTNLSEATKGELNAAAQHKRLREAIGRTAARADADALIAASTHEECVLRRRTLKMDECDDEGKRDS